MFYVKTIVNCQKALNFTNLYDQKPKLHKVCILICLFKLKYKD